MADERRQHPRQAVELAARIRVADVDEFVDRYARDLSARGMQLVLKQPVENGTKIYVEFRLAAGQPVISTIAAVRWCRPAGQLFHAGVEFLDLDADAEVFIREALVYAEERRQHRRVPVNFTARVEVPSLQTFVKSYARDLSMGGMRLTIDRQLKPGDHVRIEFDTPAGDEIFHAGGSVRWCRPADGREGFRLGVEFRELDGPTRQLIGRILRAREAPRQSERDLFD